MSDFDPIKVSSDESAFKTESTRLADVKSKALAAFFAPKDIQFFAVDPKATGDALRFYAQVNTSAIINRLDIVLGQDGWREQYESLTSDSVKCIISARFTPDGEWVYRAGIGTGLTQKSAHREAFERAAVKYGIGRYLYDLPEMRSTVLPQAVLPTLYRYCGRVVGAEYCGLLESACQSDGISQSEYKKAYQNIIGRYDYPSETKPDKITLRDAELIKQQLSEWINHIARGIKNSVHSPFYTDVKENVEEEKKSEEKKIEPEKPTQILRLPANGRELYDRLLRKEFELVDAKRCKHGQMLDYIHGRGKAASYPNSIAEWSGDHIRAAFKFAQEFLDHLEQKNQEKK
jgi:hypothetical protein